MDRKPNHTQQTTPQVLIAVGPKDKENFATPDAKLKKSKTILGGATKKNKSFLNNNIKKKNVEMIKNAINETEIKNTTTADDLITKGKPSEGYWEQLSESRRVALDSTLKENADLHSKIMELEYENTRLKSMLSEANNAIKLLTELVDDDIDSAHGDSIRTLDPSDEDSD